MIRQVLFLLTVMAICLVILTPLVGSLIWLHRHTFSRTALAAWAVGAMIYVAFASVILANFLATSGLGQWAES